MKRLEKKADVCSEFSSPLNYRFSYASQLNWTDFHCWGLAQNTTFPLKPHFFSFLNWIRHSVDLTKWSAWSADVRNVVRAFLLDWSSVDQVTPLTSCMDLYCGWSILSNLFDFVNTIEKLWQVHFLFPFPSVGTNLWQWIFSRYPFIIGLIFTLVNILLAKISTWFKALPFSHLVKHNLKSHLTNWGKKSLHSNCSEIKAFIQIIGDTSMPGKSLPLPKSTWNSELDSSTKLSRY